MIAREKLPDVRTIGNNSMHTIGRGVGLSSIRHKAPETLESIPRRWNPAVEQAGSQVKGHASKTGLFG